MPARTAPESQKKKVFVMGSEAVTLMQQMLSQMQHMQAKFDALDAKFSALDAKFDAKIAPPSTPAASSHARSRPSSLPRAVAPAERTVAKCGAAVGSASGKGTAPEMRSKATDVGQRVFNDATGSSGQGGSKSQLGSRDRGIAVEEGSAGTSGKRITRRSDRAVIVAEMAETALAQIRAGSVHCTIRAVSTGIGDAGVKLITPEIHSLVSLDLRNNNIEHEGLRSLMKSIEHSSTLLSLELSYNRLADIGGTILGKALKQNRSMTHLGLFACNIDVAGLKALAQGLAVNTKMLSLPYFVPCFKSSWRAVTCPARSLTVRELGHELDIRGLDTDGRRDELVSRLQTVLDRYSEPVESIQMSLARNKRFVEEEMFTAFVMGLHQRLGEGSVVRMLSNGEDILRGIAKAVRAGQRRSAHAGFPQQWADGAD